MGAPKKPKLRPLEFIPVEKDGRRFVYVRDPFGVVSQGLLLSEEAVRLASFMDGERKVEDIQYEVLRRFGLIVTRDEIESLVESFDEHLLLESERFKKALLEEKKRFRGSKVRSPILAGTSYPSDPSQLASFVDGILDGWDGRFTPSRKPSGVVAPHLEINLAREGYAASYGVLKEAGGFDCIVVIGTGHFLFESPISITTKDFTTPLGTIKNMRDVTERMAERFSWAYDSEIFHRTEHSIEVQLIFIKRVFEDVRIVPILAGFDTSSMDEPFWVDFMDELLELLPDNSLFVASVDLSHVGPRYGDPNPLDLVDLSMVREDDEKLIRILCSVDMDAYINKFRTEGNIRRVCGFSPLLLMMKAMKGRKGTLLLYDRREVDGRGSYVSFASIVYE